MVRKHWKSRTGCQVSFPQRGNSRGLEPRAVKTNYFKPHTDLQGEPKQQIRILDWCSHNAILVDPSM